MNQENPLHHLPPSVHEQVRRGYHSGLDGIAIDEENFRQENSRQENSRQDAARRDATRELRAAAEDLDAPEASRTVYFWTARYVPPHQVIVRGDQDGWTVDHEGTYNDEFGFWKFELPAAQYGAGFQMKFVYQPEEGGDFWQAGGNIGVDQNVESPSYGDNGIRFGFEIHFATDRWRPNHLITVRNDADGWEKDLFSSYREGRWTFFFDRTEYHEGTEAKLVLDQRTFMEGENIVLSAAQVHHHRSDDDLDFPTSPTAFRHCYDNFSSVTSRWEQLNVRTIGREYDEYDVIVIGSGMSGGSLADELSDRGVKVLVLEAGGLRYPVHHNELPRLSASVVGRDELDHFDKPQNNHFGPGVHFNLGGRSVYWSGLIPRMQRWEFRGIWPTEVRDYLLDGQESLEGMSGYERAERLMRKRKTLGPYHDRVREHLNTHLDDEYVAIDLPRALHQPFVDETGALVNQIERSTGGFSTADLLLDSLGADGPAGRRNLTINLHQLVIGFETEDDRVTGVVCQDLVGHTERTFRAKHVVLACGSVESAKLFKQSGLDDPNGKAATGLTDHPAYFYKKLHNLPVDGPLGWLGHPDGHSKMMIRNTGASESEHAYNIELLINGRYWDARHADDDLWEQHHGHEFPAQVEIKFIFDSLIDEDNRIEPRGLENKPLVVVNKNTPPDRYRAEAVQVRNHILGTLGVTGLNDEWDWNEWGIGESGTVHHAGGSLRMSSDGSGVVDQHLKFEAYDNLHCCDVSVFPTIPAANPSLTAVALALRLADRLRERIDAE